MRATLTGAGRRLPRSFFARDSPTVAADLLGRVLVAHSPAGPVGVRLSEVEAYDGAADPASHAFRGPTRRNAVMFGPAGHLYLYFIYGMHWCANVVTGPPEEASAVLLRAGTVVARTIPPDGSGAMPVVARGPASLTRVLGLSAASYGLDLCDPRSGVWVTKGSPPDEDLVCTGPRVGVSAAAEVPWRWWISDDPSVSAYRPGPRTRPAAGA